MKIQKLLSIFLLLTACTQSTNNKTEGIENIEEVAQEETLEAEVSFEPRSETWHSVDTLNGNFIIKELKKIGYFKNGEGYIKEFSLKNPGGNEVPYSSYYDEPFPTDFMEAKSKIASLTDTAFTENIGNGNEAFYQVNKDGQLIHFKNFFYDISIEKFQGDRWIKAILGYKDERSGHMGYTIINRDYEKSNTPPANYYLTINGQDLLTKSNKNIVDYYILAMRFDEFNPDQIGGNFDLKNGYFDYTTESTGAGHFVEQLVLFRTTDGIDILGINAYGTEALSFPVTSGSQPRFLTFKNNEFIKLKDIFPAIKSNVFFAETYAADTGVPTYFKLPQYGLSITYHVSKGAFTYCEELNADLAEDWAIDLCEVYSNIKKRTVEIPFNKATGKFQIQELL